MIGLRAWTLSATVLLATGVAPAAAETADPGATLTQLVQEVGGRGATTTPQHYAYLRKIDSHLQDVAASRLGTGSATNAALAARRQGVTVSVQGAALVDVYVHGNVQHAADHLRALGMRVTAVSDRAPQRMVEGYLPPESIAPAAALAETQAIITTFMRVNTGSVTSLGDDSTNGPEARALGPTGAGVPVGVISDSINQQNGGISASVNSLDLPADTVALSDKAGGTDEGRAMAEILYDEAPGVPSIRFETASGGAAAKANAIDALVASGVKVIADDTGYLGEPFFQDDVVAQAVDRAKAAGVAYFISAGNDARNAWEGTYAPVPAGGATTNDFGSGDTIQTIGPIPAGVELDLVLQWAEPWGHVATDLAIDVYVMNGTTATFKGTFNSANTVTGIPEEAFAFTAPAMPADTTIGIAIRRVAGSANPFMKYIAFTDGPALTMGHPVISGSISPDAASARGALTIAASPFDTPTTPEDFSSRGPVTHFFDVNGNRLAAPEVRPKPDLAAPDGVSTSLASFTPFFGTSAAAPAAAGIAALIRSAKPAMAIDELYAIMTSPENALDCTLSAAVPDPDCGAGFVLADAAVAMALDATPPVVTPVVTPAAPDGANGWYRGPVTVTWDASDPESPVVDPVGCAAASPGDGTSVLTCNATSAGGTTSVPLTIKRDSTAPSTPAITGIGAKTYLPATLPKASAVHCSAADPTSGIAGCTVAGYGTGPGAHTLTATATNAAGLTSTATLRFTVAKPAAIAKLRLAKPTLSRLRSSGLTLTVRVAAGSTRLVVELVATVARMSGSGTRTIAVGALKTKAGAGRHTLRIRLSPAGKRALRSRSKAALTVVVTGSSTRSKAASLTGSLMLKG